MLNLFLLLIGFTMLIKGADVFVESASGIARKFGIPSIVIGLTIVAMGTSAPELSVSLSSSLSGLNDMSIANVVGSNIFNILMITGISSMIGVLKINNFKNVYITLGICTLLLFLIINGTLGRIDGLILLGVFAYYLYTMFKLTKIDKSEDQEIKNEKPLWLTIILGLVSLGCIVFGGDIVVDSASTIATQLGMSENLVGLTIVAVGTSLPECVTSLIATKKGELDIAIGNVLGSNIFNILLILGVASLINPMTVSLLAVIDILVMLIVTSIFAILTWKTKLLENKKGIVLILIYIAYIIFTIIR